MDNSMTAGRIHAPVTLALACALEDTGNLFAAAQAIAAASQADAALRPLAQLMCDIIAPRVDMGAVYIDATGCKRIDRQALCDFGVVVCGLSRHAVLGEVSLHELSLFHRKLAPRVNVQATPPSADFMAQMAALFPDQPKEQQS